MTISRELLDEQLEGCERPEDLLGDSGLMKELKIKLMERMLGAELTAHLGYEESKDASPSQANRRNGTSAKVLKGQDGTQPIIRTVGAEPIRWRPNVRFRPLVDPVNPLVELSAPAS